MRAAGILILLLSAAIIASFGQTVPAKLSGRIVDIMSAPIAGAEVALWSTDERNAIRGTTNGSGWYSFEGLTEGDYTLRVFAPGFRSLTIRALPISSGQDLTVPLLELPVGGSCDPVVDDLGFLPSVEENGSLGGRIRLQTGPDARTPAPDAEATLLCDAGVVCGKARTDSDGKFLFTKLATGTYAVRASYAGHYSETYSGYQVRPGYEWIYFPIDLEPCPRGNCDPKLHPQKPLQICE